MQVTNRGFCSFYQSYDRTKFPKKPPDKNFSRHSNSSCFVAHNYKLHFFCQSLNERLFRNENIFGGNIVDFVPWIGILIFRIMQFSSVSSRYWNSESSVTRGLISSILVSVKNLKPVEFYWQIEQMMFSWHQNLDTPKILKYAIIFDLSRHAKSSLTANTVFMSSIKVKIKEFPLLRGISGFSYPFRSLQLTSDSPRKARGIFQYGVFPVFKAMFHVTTNMMSSLKVSN